MDDHSPAAADEPFDECELSALLDGELDAPRAEHVQRLINQRSELRQRFEELVASDGVWRHQASAARFTPLVPRDRLMERGVHLTMRTFQPLVLHPVLHPVSLAGITVLLLLSRLALTVLPLDLLTGVLINVLVLAIPLSLVLVLVRSTEGSSRQPTLPSAH